MIIEGDEEEKETFTTGESTPPARGKLQKRPAPFSLEKPKISVRCLQEEEEGEMRKRGAKREPPAQFQMLSYYKPHKKKRAMDNYGTK